jgi:hypothetical protein
MACVERHGFYRQDAPAQCAGPTSGGNAPGKDAKDGNVSSGKRPHQTQETSAVL